MGAETHHSVRMKDFFYKTYQMINTRSESTAVRTSVPIKESTFFLIVYNYFIRFFLKFVLDGLGMSWGFVNGPNCSAAGSPGAVSVPASPSALRKRKEAVPGSSHVAAFMTHPLGSLGTQHVLGLHPLIELLGREVAEFDGGGLQGGPVFVRGLSNLCCVVIA